MPFLVYLSMRLQQGRGVISCLKRERKRALEGHELWIDTMKTVINSERRMMIARHNGCSGERAKRSEIMHIENNKNALQVR
jgi:hypothetical protein